MITSPKIVKTWMGAAPERCDECRLEIKREFSDALTSKGFWAILCPICSKIRGEFGPVRYGPGLGQRYLSAHDVPDDDPHRVFVKVEG